MKVDASKAVLDLMVAANEGNQTATAAQLEIGSATLYRKLKRYREIEAES